LEKGLMIGFRQQLLENKLFPGASGGFKLAPMSGKKLCMALSLRAAAFAQQWF